MLFAKGVAKPALVLGFASALSLAAIAPAAAQININVPGLHVHVGRHHHRHYYAPPAPYYGYRGGYNTWNGCPPNFTIQDGVCKPYRGY